MSLSNTGCRGYRIGIGERPAVLTLSNADLMMEGKGHRRQREEMSIAQKRGGCLIFIADCPTRVARCVQRLTSRCKERVAGSAHLFTWALL